MQKPVAGRRADHLDAIGEPTVVEAVELGVEALVHQVGETGPGGEAWTTTGLGGQEVAGGHLLDVEYRNCMDWEYYLRLTRAGFRFSYVGEPLAGFRWL